jgi:hypothetical protein
MGHSITYTLTTCDKVASSESHQRAVLVTGIELALYMSNRLKVYLDTCACLAPSTARDNFRKAVVSLYVHILRFMAHAIRIQRKNSALRVAQALWDSEDLMQFEERCDILCVRASEEARICDNQRSLVAQLRTLDEIHSVRASVAGLHDKADLAKLIIAKGATYDSSAEGELARCFPGTRTEMIQRIADWAIGLTGERIFWLCGKAGTGKSTIARTIAQKLDEDGLLGASFFFKRGRADRSNATLLFPTIARQLADLIPEAGHTIAGVLDQDSLLCDKHLKPQFDKLLLQPLQSLSSTAISSAGVVLVIDALDECDNSESVRTILLLLSRVEAITSIRLRIFVTSRPELPVELGFKDMSGDLHHDVRLEEAQQTTIARDIRIFYEHQFQEIKRNSWQHYDELPVGWPAEQSIQSLVVQAVPLFIFAFTVSRYIAEADPIGRLDLMLQQHHNKSLSGLMGTYLPILNQLVACEVDGQRSSRIVEFQHIVGSIVLLDDPLSASALSCLLDTHPRDLTRILRPLHSVLSIPRAADGRIDLTTPITLFHLSFRDFLVDPELKDENMFWIRANERHEALGRHCIRLLESGSLKEDVCGVVRPGTRRAEVTKKTVYAGLPEAVVYACRYWVQHIAASGERIADNDKVHRFLNKHLLHWIEALSWLGKASDVIHNLKTLQSIVDVSHVLTSRFRVLC